MKNKTKNFTRSLCFVLILCLLFITAGCSNKEKSEDVSSSKQSMPSGEVDNTSQTKQGQAMLFGMTQEEADENFAELLDGLFTGKTTETIMETNVGEDFFFHFPDMLYFNNRYWAYYITDDTHNGNGGVGLATSLDGLKWKNMGCVIQPDQDYDSNGAYFAGVWLDDDGKFYLVYEAKGSELSEYGVLENVALATSVDGENWTKEGIILYKDTTIEWQNINIGTPDLYKKDGVWYLTFHGFNGTDCQIGLAYGTDLHNLKLMNTPIIPTVDGTPYSGTTGRRDIIFVGGYYYMVYEVSTDMVDGEGYNGAKWSHMFARSKNMVDWETTKAPFLVQYEEDGKTEKTGMGYDGPCWFARGNRIYVYMRTGGHTSSVLLKRAK